MRRLLETLSLSDQVRRHLLVELTSGSLRPGDRINEAELSRRLGISRNPIREAISGLAQRGFLVAAPRRGHFLRSFTARDIDDVFSFRICVESFALRQAMPRMTGGDRRDLKRSLERMIGAASAGRLAELQQADMALHRHLCELSGNRQVVRAHESIDTEVQMLIALVDLETESPMQSALIHVPLIEAIATGDVEDSVAALEEHLRATWAFVVQKYQEAGIGETPAAGGGLRRSGRAAAAPA